MKILSGQFRSMLLAAVFSGLLLITSSTARGQGIVLSKEGKPLTVKRARVLLIFQDRGILGEYSNRPNREDLFVQLELAAPAPDGARWYIAFPPGGALAKPASTKPIEEVSSYWRQEREVPLKRPWPTVDDGVTIKLRKDKSPPQIIKDNLSADWEVFSGLLPEGCLVTPAAYLHLEPLIVTYPGRLGAIEIEGDAGEKLWCLAPTDFMILHSHFVNVDDNSKGTEARLLLKKIYQDKGTLAEGSPLWFVAPANPGMKRDPGLVLSGRLPETEKMIKGLDARRSLWLTVLSGSATRPSRAELDFRITSHFPSAIEPRPPWAFFLVFGGCCLVLVFGAHFLLRRKGMLE
jgi:hypothetical protein